MFSLVAGSAQCHGRSDEPIRTQRDRSTSQDRPNASRRTKRRSEKESDSSNKYPPIIVGPLTTNQDLTAVKGEKTFNLPLMIQQPFLREKKEPIKVDISVKLIPKQRKKERKRREAQVEEIVVDDVHLGVKNCISMEVVDGDINLLKETVEVFEDEGRDSGKDSKMDERDSPNITAENKEVSRVVVQNTDLEENLQDIEADVQPKKGINDENYELVDKTDTHTEYKSANGESALDEEEKLKDANLNDQTQEKDNANKNDS